MNHLKPFLKWAGGKTQLLPKIESLVPYSYRLNEFTYIEPFVGSGAVLFRFLSIFPTIKKAVVNDINSDLINVYKVIADNKDELIEALDYFEKEYHAIDAIEDEKRIYYNSKRAQFNARKSGTIEHAALFIFLNKTCFNGLYRVNRNNENNVPMGSYSKPLICDRKTIEAVSKALQKVIILNGDYSNTIQYADAKTLFYLDPPYKPLNETSSFNSYSKELFDDKEQIRLKEFCEFLNGKGYDWILSNSDPKSINESNDFFDKIYEQFNIHRVAASRSINSSPDKRGKLNELLISNTILDF